MKTKEVPVCGLAAVQALFARDPAAIKRLYFDYATGRRVAKISSALAKAKKIYRVVEPAELEKIASTVHHGGIVAITEARPLRAPGPVERRAWAENKTPLLLLDRIGNAHNLGAIVRTAAFLGVEHIVIPDHPQQALPGEAAHRVAEGGMEHVQIWRVPSLADFCRELAATHDVLGTAVNGTALALPEWRSRGAQTARPVALVLGNEEHGLAPDVAAACARLVTIPGSGRVESLNVSAAAAILMWVLLRPRA